MLAGSSAPKALFAATAGFALLALVLQGSLEAAFLLGNGSWAADTSTEHLLELLGISPVDSLAALSVVRLAAACVLLLRTEGPCDVLWLPQRVVPLVLLLAAAAGQVGSSSSPAARQPAQETDSIQEPSTSLARPGAVAAAGAALAGIAMPALPTAPFLLATVWGLVQWGFRLPEAKPWAVHLWTRVLQAYTGESCCACHDGLRNLCCRR